MIVFEGIDGAGKTTQAHLLAERMRRAGTTVVESKEPTTGPHGRRLRESASSGRLPAAAELELFILDRKEHVRDLLAPALAQGKAVIVDRYYLSTAAYQGARGLDAEEIMAANEGFAPIPDAAVVLEIEVAGGRERIRKRGDGDGNLFEREAELERVATVFDSLERPYIERFDGRGSIEDVHAAIVSRLQRLGIVA